MTAAMVGFPIHIGAMDTFVSIVPPCFGVGMSEPTFVRAMGQVRQAVALLRAAGR